MDAYVNARKCVCALQAYLIVVHFETDEECIRCISLFIFCSAGVRECAFGMNI